MNAERAIVYRGGGRRYFTARAAARAEARARYFAKYPCECERPQYEEGGCVYPGYDCGCSGDGPRNIRERFARFILRAFRRSLIIEQHQPREGAEGNV